MMHEKLIGYLLGALESEETDDVEHLLRTSPDARQQMEVIKLGMMPLEADRDLVEAPVELLMRTCHHIRARHRHPQANS